jgi:hypothetical protein
MLLLPKWHAIEKWYMQITITVGEKPWKIIDFLMFSKSRTGVSEACMLDV